MTIKDILDSCEVTQDEYDNAMNTMQKSAAIHYRRKPNETMISPYNTVLLSVLKANMNLQFVTGVYGLLTYLTAYLCKPEKVMSELMKKASKEATGEGIRGKLKKIGNVFLTKREVGMHEATLRLLSTPFRRSNLFVLYIPSGPQEDRVRMLKSRDILDQMDPDDTNIFATNMVEKYANRPDELENMCYAEFATSYINKNVKEIPEDETIGTYTTPVNVDEEELESSNKIITQK